eukprot:3253168-Prymnesium_polylepis.1
MHAALLRRVRAGRPASTTTPQHGRRRAMSLVSPSPACGLFPPLRVEGTRLVRQDGGAASVFAAGMVLSGGGKPQLSGYSTNSAQVERTLAEHAALGATVIRWNTFLKGIDFAWDESGNIIGLKPGCFEVLTAVLDRALQHGLLVQVVLATAHFLRYVTAAGL